MCFFSLQRRGHLLQYLVLGGGLYLLDKLFLRTYK
jgi:hypothetical protein